MARALHPCGRALILLLNASLCMAQASALDRVLAESVRLRQTKLPPQPTFWEELKDARDRSATLRAALRDWVESLLPRSKTALDSQLQSTNTKLQADLLGSQLIAPGKGGEFTPGLVSAIQLSRPPEAPDKVVVTVGISVPCGVDDAVYIYDYSQGRPLRVLESHGTRNHDESISGVRFSKRDSQGGQLILTLRYGVQCGSSWNSLSYNLFQLSPATGAAVPLYAGEQGIWFGDDDAYELRLDPAELLLQVIDRSIDAAIHSRPHVLHFKTDGSTTERVDPVALQPHDFADEWLTRPWPEMESRSSESGRDVLKEWHRRLTGGYISGEFQFVQQCREPTDQWQIGIELFSVKGKELPKPLKLYFLVLSSGKYRFKMVDVSRIRQPDCPRNSYPNERGPTLFPAAEEKRP